MTAVETGTLLDLNVHRGDVVEFVRGGHNEVFAIGNGETGTYDNDVSGVLISGHGWYTKSYDAVFRIISRATTPSPVITETVTTQRIVPGQYGRLQVLAASDHHKTVLLEFVDGDIFDATELTAVIGTLTAVRDALK